MGLLLILPILVCGYIFCNNSFYRQATISKYEGQLLYLLVAKFGLLIFSFASFVSFLLVYLSKHAAFTAFNLDYLHYVRAFLLRNELADSSDVALSMFFGQASLLALLFAKLFAPLHVISVKWRYRLQNRDQARTFILNESVPGGLFTKELLASMRERDRHYMFSMADRKVYIGQVVSIGAPDETRGIDEDFAIVPICSGYRDADTLEVTFTTYYEDMLQELRGANLHVDFSIVLSQKNIVSMARFEKAVWEKFKARKRERSSPLVTK